MTSSGSQVYHPGETDVTSICCDAGCGCTYRRVTKEYWKLAAEVENEYWVEPTGTTSQHDCLSQ